LPASIVPCSAATSRFFPSLPRITLRPMAVVLGALAVGLVMLIAAVVILRESRRLASLPPRPVFDIDEALDWVVQHIADHAAATPPMSYRRSIGAVGSPAGGFAAPAAA